jgi:uncharacterized membrane protein
MDLILNILFIILLIITFVFFFTLTIFICTAIEVYFGYIVKKRCDKKRVN